MTQLLGVPRELGGEHPSILDIFNENAKIAPLCNAIIKEVAVKKLSVAYL